MKTEECVQALVLNLNSEKYSDIYRVFQRQSRLQFNKIELVNLMVYDRLCTSLECQKAEVFGLLDLLD